MRICSILLPSSHPKCFSPILLRNFTKFKPFGVVACRATADHRWNISEDVAATLKRCSFSVTFNSVNYKIKLDFGCLD